MAKITVIKNCELNGSPLVVGTELEVTSKFGIELVEERVAIWTANAPAEERAVQVKPQRRAVKWQGK